MAVIAFKSRTSPLRQLLKILKEQFDNPAVLKRYEPALRRLIFFGQSPQDRNWRGEGLHWLALCYQSDGKVDEANKYYVESLNTFQDHERLGLARVMRDYGLFMTRYHDPNAGLAFTEQALALHRDDQRNAKGERQRRITESYVWRAQLLVDNRNKKAKRSLIEFALSECRDCSLPDQQQAIEFALGYAKGIQRQMLDARLVEINARRRKPYGTVMSMAKFVIDVQLMTASRLVETVLRKE